MTRTPRPIGRRGWLPVLVVVFCLASATPAVAQVVTSVKAKNALTGAPFVGPAALTGALASGDPSTEPSSPLSPIVRWEVVYLGRATFEPDMLLKAQGDLTSPYGTIPLSRLTWNGAGIDPNGSRWYATGSTANPSNQPLAVTMTPFGHSPILEATFYFDMQYQLANSWLTPWGSYSGSLTYGVKEGLNPTVSQDLPFSIDVPARMSLAVPATNFELIADPSAAAPATSPVTATLKTNARSTESTILKLQATPLTDGTNTLPFSAFTFRLGAGPDIALSDSDQTIATFTGASAGTTYDLAYRVAPSWAHPAGRYTSTLTYTAEHGGGAATPQALPATTVDVEVPQRLMMSLDQPTVSLAADPLQAGSENVATGAATLTVRSNYGQSRVYVSATVPTASTVSLPVSALQYRVSPTSAPDGGGSVAATVALDRGDGTWASFTTTDVPIATLTGRTDGAVLTYDYRVERNWQFPGASYTSTVTYTAAGL